MLYLNSVQICAVFPPVFQCTVDEVFGVLGKSHFICC